MIRLKQLLVVVTLVAGMQTLGRAQEPRCWIGDNKFGDDSGLVVAETTKPNLFAAYSKFSGQWNTFSFPADAKVTPISGGGNVVAFRVDAGSMTKLVAVDRNGQWRVQELIQSINTDTTALVPVVSKNVVVCQNGQTAYAFSGLTGQWDSIDSGAEVKTSSDTAMIVTSDRIVVFSAQSGKWAASPELASAK